MSTRVSDYRFSLPPDLIAQRPLPRREDSRLMVLRRAAGTIEHARFTDLPALLHSDDLLVLNNSRVFAARYSSGDGVLDFLFLEKLGPRRWKALVKPARKFREAVTICGVIAEPGEHLADGSREILLAEDLDLQRAGSMPLPPYIRRPSEKEDEARYQTVFAQEEGSLAAPTAGLHFTSQMLSEIHHTFVTLHVGTGTFRPVKCQEITEHRMHAEKFSLSQSTADGINSAPRIVAVGTTTVRVLESVYRERGMVCATEGETNIFIFPPFTFGVVDALLTNFHLPHSTLLMLVSAFAGREFILRAYAEAVQERYRFFSYGDCMLIL